MAINSTYPIIVPKAEDLIVGTQTYTAADPVLDNPTKNFTVQSVVDLASAAPNVVKNNTDTYNTPKVTHIITLTQAEYTALVAAGTPNVNTLFIIV